MSSSPGTRRLLRPAAMFFLLFLALTYLFLNLELVRSDKYSTQTLPSDISKLSQQQREQLRRLYEQMEQQNGEPILSQPHMDKSVPESQAELLSIRSRRNRPLPKCASDGERAQTFLMVFMGHSGSTAILSELYNHSQVHVGTMEPVDHQEVFNTTEALKRTREIFNYAIRQGRTVGFKIRPNHVLAEPEAWRELVVEYKTRIVWQYRKNIMKAAIGEYSNRYLNDTSAIEGLKLNLSREERCRIGAGCSYRIENFGFLHYQLRSMLYSQNSIAGAVKVLSGDSPCVREMPYEDYLYDRDAFMADLNRFLGLGREDTTPERFKATSDNMCEVVENWDELCDKFYGCILWQPLLDDPRNNCFCKLASGSPTSGYCSMAPPT